MPPYKSIVGFLLRLTVIYALLQIAWIGIGGAFAQVFRGLGNVAAAIAETPRWTVDFRPLDPPSDQFDTETLLTNRTARMNGRMSLSSFNLAYQPTVSMLALILATPLPWRRRGRALLLALPLLLIFIAVRTALPILHEFTRDNALTLCRPTEWQDRLLAQAIATLVHAPATYFIVPIFIWIVVAFRAADIQQWMKPKEDRNP